MTTADPRVLAERYLAGLPRRWRHVQGVGHRAEHVAEALRLSDGALVAAAWLHDIGYGPAVADTGFHPPRTLKTVDPRIVINVEQAQRLLAATRSQGSRGERLVAFFACMYYAALRLEEVIGLRRTHLVSLPAHGWGEMRLTHSEPRSGSRWTNSGLPTRSGTRLCQRG